MLMSVLVKCLIDARPLKRILACQQVLSFYLSNFSNLAERPWLRYSKHLMNIFPILCEYKAENYADVDDDIKDWFEVSYITGIFDRPYPGCDVVMNIVKELQEAVKNRQVYELS